MTERDVNFFPILWKEVMKNESRASKGMDSRVYLH